MGVFSWFSRKSRTTVEASADTGSGDTAAAAEAPEAEEVVAAVAEGVEIPRQQSAGDAADSETGEGARK
ncbi:gliding motility protein [Streptomyces sp. NPDC051018]|uniref:gliding motility protein n=1 Tax=Streptomyces sp. NPDC051018 TaxID=3365639 RepID=UPI003797E6BA